MAEEAPLLDVKDLRVDIDTRRGTVHAVRGLSYSLAAGESLAIVGESGCGKSIGALALLGLLPRRARIVEGSIRLQGRELVGATDRELRTVRGGRAALIFQDSLSSLNPVLKIGRQIVEQLEAHGRADGAAARRLAVELLERVGIPEAARRADQHPHELSGGMRQRAMIAMALSCDPALLIADEPTTALDVTIQAQILELLAQLQETLGMGLLLITHDLGVVARFVDRVAVMYAGRFVEVGSASTILAAPAHPYTEGLLASIPRIDRPREAALRAIPGAPPDLREMLTGCPFGPRCPRVLARCASDLPQLEPLSADQEAACWAVGASGVNQISHGR